MPYIADSNTGAVRWVGDEAAYKLQPGEVNQGFDPTPLIPAQVLFESAIKDCTDAIQKRLDDFARTRNYDGILSAATYATSTVAKFRAEGQYAVEARDATWAKGYEILADVEAGTRAAPTLDELAAELPALVWPQ